MTSDNKPLMYCNTGCWHRSESTTRLLFSCIGVRTDLLRRTCLLIYRASRTYRRDSDYGHGRWTRLPSLRRTCSLLATALSRLPLHESGTLCRRTFVHPALCQLSSIGASHKASLTDATVWIFILFVRSPRSFGFCHPNLFVLLLLTQ